MVKSKMPFTPFHLGPAILIGLLFFPLIDIIIICIASVIVDIEPAYYLFFTQRGPYHGLLHTYLAATIISFLLTLIMYPLRNKYPKLLGFFGLKQETNHKRMLISALIGTYSHIFLDSFLYPEMHPFYPIRGNVMLYALSPITVYGICILSFLLAGIIYVIRIIWGK